MADEAKVQLLATRLRCPLCHGPLEAPGPAATCPSCATAYHAACVTELGVPCTTLGCALGPKPPPKRGAVVTAELLGTRDVAPRKGLVWPLVLTWLLYPLWPVGLAVWSWAFVRASDRRQRRGPVAVTLLASPFVVVPFLSALGGLHGYATGTASLTGPYFDDSPVFTGLDPQVRCEVRPDASLGPELGLKVLADGPYEVVLRGLAGLFGPMAHAYTGELPSPDGAGALLGQGPTVPVEQVDAFGPAIRIGPDHDGRLRLELDEEPLDLAVSPDLYWRAWSQESRAKPHRARIARVEGGGLLVSDVVRPERALLCDLRTRRAVAVLTVTPPRGAR